MDIIYEFNLVLTNIPFLIPAIIFFYKLLFIPGILFICITFASGFYHICFLPKHLHWITNYVFYGLCPINNVIDYGISLMFLDIWCATACSYALFIFLLPIHIIKKRENENLIKRFVYYRYSIMCLGLFIVVVIGAWVGFFPLSHEENHNIKDLSKFLKYIDVNKQRSNKRWNTVLNIIVLMSKTEKSKFITLFSFMFVLLMYSLHLYIFLYEKYKYKKGNKKLNQRIDTKEYLILSFKRYYKRMFHIKLLLASIIVGFVGIIIWIVFETLYPNIYKITHGQWHLCSVISGILFSASLIVDETLLDKYYYYKIKR